MVGDFSETPHRTRDNTDFPRPLRKGEARLRLACSCGKGAKVMRKPFAEEPIIGVLKRAGDRGQDAGPVLPSGHHLSYRLSERTVDITWVLPQGGSRPSYPPDP